MTNQPRREVEIRFSEEEVRAAVVAELLAQYSNIIEDDYVITESEAQRIAKEVIRRLRETGG